MTTNDIIFEDIDIYSYIDECIDEEVDNNTIVPIELIGRLTSEVLDAYPNHRKSLLFNTIHNCITIHNTDVYRSRVQAVILSKTNVFVM